MKAQNDTKAAPASAPPQFPKVEAESGEGGEAKKERKPRSGPKIGAKDLEQARARAAKAVGEGTTIVHTDEGKTLAIVAGNSLTSEDSCSGAAEKLWFLRGLAFGANARAVATAAKEKA